MRALQWLRRLLRARARRRAEQRALMVALHRSAAWHCGCWLHRQSPALQALPAGELVRWRAVFGFIPEETVRLSPSELEKLR